MSILVPSKKSSSLDDKLIPLINIIFLLLIFFMIAGQISQPENPAISVPYSDSEKPLSATTALLELEEGGALKRNGENMSLEQLTHDLERGSLTSPIKLKADKQVLAAELDKVLAELKRQGISTVTLYSQNRE